MSETNVALALSIFVGSWFAWAIVSAATNNVGYQAGGR